MAVKNIKVDVHCLGPRWVTIESNKYRLYVNDDMVTERNWIWEISHYIREDIWVELEHGVENIIKIEPILNPSNSTAQFVLKGLTINNSITPDDNINRTQLSFIVTV